MSKNNFFEKIVHRLTAVRRKAQTDLAAYQIDAEMVKLLQMVDGTDDDEIPCDEVFELIDRYVELEERGEDAASLLPFVKKHLDRCRDCLEEYEALARIIREMPG